MYVKSNALILEVIMELSKFQNGIVIRNKIIKHAIDEGKEAVHKTRSGIEERRREKSEE